MADRSNPFRETVISPFLEYADTQSAAYTIRTLANRQAARGSPEERRVALALADAIEGTPIVNHQLRWYLGDNVTAMLSRLDVVKALIPQIGWELGESGLIEIQLVLSFCFGYYVVPLTPERPINDVISSSPPYDGSVPILLSFAQWDALDTLFTEARPVQGMNNGTGVDDEVFAFLQAEVVAGVSGPEREATDGQ